MNESHQMSRKVFGALLKHTPDAVLEHTTAVASDHPYTSLQVTHYLEEYLHDYTNLNIAHEEVENNLLLVCTGIRDTHYVVIDSLERAPHHLTEAESLAVATHPQTQRTLALLALREQDRLTHVLTPPTPHEVPYFAIDPSGTAIYSTDKLQPESHGCPFAGKGSELQPDPLFLRFARWAGEFSVKHYFRQ